MTVGQVVSKEMEKLDQNDAQLHLEAVHRIWVEFSAIIGFPDDPKDMLTLYTAYLVARKQSWSVGIKKKLRGYWKAFKIKILLRHTIADVRKGTYDSGDLLIKTLASKIEKWL